MSIDVKESAELWEVSVIEVREVLRAWLAGSGFRTAGAQAGVDRKTARRYVAAAVAAGLDRDGGVDQLDDELIATVVAADARIVPRGTGLRGKRCAPTMIGSTSGSRTA